MGNQANVYQLHEGQRVMPSKNGYVNLWRDINEQPWSSDELAYSVFIKLLSTVQHKPRDIVYKGKPVHLESGEWAIDYPQIVGMFKGIKDKEHARRIIKKFKSLSQVYTKPLKNGSVHIGFVIGFNGWEKWQNCTTPQTTPQTTPNSTDLKVLEGGKTTPQTTPQTTHKNNNDLNNNKEYAGSATPPVHSELRKNAFNYFWKKWADCKELVGLKNKAPKEKTYTNNFAKLFTDSYINRIGVEAFKAEVNQMCAFALEAHQDIASKQGTNQTSDYFNHEKMWPAKFLSNKQWREQA